MIACFLHDFGGIPIYATLLPECLTLWGKWGKNARGNEVRALPPADQYVNERLDHLGIVAGVCQEIGLAAWLDTQDERSHVRVSVGTATVAMILEWPGFQPSAALFSPPILCRQAP